MCARWVMPVLRPLYVPRRLATFCVRLWVDPHIIGLLESCTSYSSRVILTSPALEEMVSGHKQRYAPPRRHPEGEAGWLRWLLWGGRGGRGFEWACCLPLAALPLAF